MQQSEVKMSSHPTSQPSPLSKINNQPLQQQRRAESFMEHWLVMPKVLYFILNIYVYGYHALLGTMFTDVFKFPYYLYALATSIVATNFLGAMLWTSLADYTGKYKLIIILTSVLYTASALFLSYYEVDIDSSLSIFYVFVGFGFFNFFLSAAFPLVDAQILGLLSMNPKVSKDQFGNQRMFGAIGHLVATLLSLNIYKHNPSNQPIFQLVVSAIFIILVFIGVKDVKPVKHGHGHHGQEEKKEKAPHQVPLATALPTAPTPAPPAANEELTAPGTKGVKHPVLVLLTNPNFLFFMLFVAFAGIVRALGSAFQKLLGAASVGGNLAKVAILDTPRTISEIAVYLCAKPLKEMLGIYWILVLSQLLGIVRLVGYAVPNLKAGYAYYLQIGLELLKGFSSGLVASSAIALASRIAPPGTENTAQGLFSGMYSGLSVAFAGLVSGGILKIYYTEGDSIPAQEIHTQWTFLWISLGTFIVTILMMLKFIYIDGVMGIPGRPRKFSIATKK